MNTFHVKRGGMLCSACGALHGGIPVDASTLYTMQFIVASPLEHLYSFQVSEEVIECLEQIMNEYMERYIDRDFHSLELLDFL